MVVLDLDLSFVSFSYVDVDEGFSHFFYWPGGRPWTGCRGNLQGPPIRVNAWASIFPMLIGGWVAASHGCRGCSMSLEHSTGGGWSAGRLFIMIDFFCGKLRYPYAFLSLGLLQGKVKSPQRRLLTTS